MSSPPVFLTGAAGFIGYHTTLRLLAEGRSVVGYDNVNDYYDIRIKHSRLEELRRSPNFSFVKADLVDKTTLDAQFKEHRFERVIHLAAQAGVRHSLSHPDSYIQSNLVGFTNMLESCRHHDVGHLVYASTSSVYGSNTKMPFTTQQGTQHPVSLYAATKKANEMMAHSYSHLFRLPTTGFRFFTVYGAMGRPDMALFKFAKAMLAGEAIDVYNHGNMRRDFTYVSDIAEAIVRLSEVVPGPNPDWNGDEPDPSTSNAPYAIYNIGNSEPVELMAMIEALEEALGMTAKKNFMPMQPGDVPATWADVSPLTAATGFTPSTPIKEGVKRFVDWYRQYYDV
jgi:UDP-glucuronate 4-epimerase